jgi:hypothetical protein
MRLERESENIQYRIREQESLKPVYQALQTKSLASMGSALPTPILEKLSRTLVGTVPTTIKRIAINASMEAVSISPDINSLLNEPGHLLVQTVLRGDFVNLRHFIMGIGELPYLERVEEIQILQDPDFMEFRLKIWLALNQ